MTSRDLWEARKRAWEEGAWAMREYAHQEMEGRLPGLSLPPFPEEPPTE